MTYKDLLNFLLTLDEEQLQSDVTVNFDDEYYSISSTEVMDEDDDDGDILDPGHPYLIV